jgi:ERAP1-like C-terminal domain
VLREALDLGLTDEIKMSEFRYLLGSVLDNRAATPVLYGWEKENWAKLLERVPSSFGREMLVRVAANLCTQLESDDARVFFVRATQGTEGIQRALDESLEKAALCVALRERRAAEVTRYYIASESGARSEKR